MDFISCFRCPSYVVVEEEDDLCPKRVAKEACRLNISTVAREAGLTPPSIHNCYPEIAELIRVKARASRQRMDPTTDSRIKQLVMVVRRLKEQLRTAENDVARIASENAALADGYIAYCRA